MNADIEVDQQVEIAREANPGLAAEADARGRHVTSRADAAADDQPAPRASVDPMRATDRYRLVRSLLA